MKAQLKQMTELDRHYTGIMFICPGCALDGSSGLHILPVNAADQHNPSWDFDDNLEAPTLHPSILTRSPSDGICHSFLKGGIFEFLSDSTHALAGQSVPMPDLPEWVQDLV